MALWDYAPVYSLEDGGSNLGQGIFILLDVRSEAEGGGTKIGPI